MTFEELLDQAIDMLRRRGRVTYRALKLQFQLDDDTLDVLKDELIYGQQLAVDEAGRVLVWGGSSATPPAATAPSFATQEAPPDQAPPVENVPTTTAIHAPHVPDAERRQLTVLFCDLVDSTSLASQLDPEDYRAAVQAYHAVCVEVIRPFDGHIAQYLGDGVLVYFGYPRAHEDDAQRAVRAGLALVEAMEVLPTRLAPPHDVRLAVRVGIHTGLVVVGAVGADGTHEQLALGETPNIAARLQGLAAPDTLLISAATARLVEGYVTVEGLGPQALKGVPAPLRIYRVVGASGVQSRLEAAAPRGLTPLVGREQEVGVLLERWQQAREGHGQVVVLSGEAGIGKSRLVQVVKDSVAEAPHMRLECRCSPYYQHTALYPITDLLHRTLQWQPDDLPEQKLARLEHTLSPYRLPLDETVPLLATLLSLPLADARYPPLAWTPQRQRHKTLGYLLAMLLEHSERQPVLFIVEDVHWADPTTLEWLGLLIEQAPTASLLALVTCRPEFASPWGLRSSLTPMALHRFARAQIETMVQRVTGRKTLPREVMQHLVEKTDGVPLYIEEMTKAMLESGVLEETDSHYELTGPLTALAIPATLQDSLMARLDRLGTAKGIAQLGATIGRQFSYELLRVVASGDEATLQRELGRLVEAGLVYQRGVLPQASYTFKHALIQDAAHQSLLRSTRQQMHKRIAQTIETRFPETVESQPEWVAHHYAEAGLIAQAVPYWQRAGERAAQQSASQEATHHLKKGLDLLMTLPETPERARHELALQATLGIVLQASRGHAAPDMERAYTRARELCQQVGNASQLIPVLFGLRRFYSGRADFQTARTLGEQLLAIAQRQHNPEYLMAAHYALGNTMFYLGAFPQVLTHMEQVVALYTPPQHHTLVRRYGVNLKVQSLYNTALTLWVTGYPDQALQRDHEAFALAHELSHCLTQAYALQYTAMLWQFRREPLAVWERAEAGIAFTTEQELPLWRAAGTILRGWALVMQGCTEKGLAQMQQGLAAHQTTGAAQWHPYFLALLAEGYEDVTQAGEGLHVLMKALAMVEKTGELWWEAELNRLRGELLRKQGTPDDRQAEVCFHQALDIARSQQAKSLELRAATSLARLWQSHGKCQEAHDLLAPIYHWFTEGFDTADLQEAKALLEALT